MPQTATLGALTLPTQFSYQPYIPAKRNSITATANAVVVQFSNPQIVHGDGMLSWSIPSANRNEFKSLWDLYNTSTPVLYTFAGYWGEVFEVYFTTFDPPRVKATLWELSGAFQVINVVEEYVGGGATACAS